MKTGQPELAKQTAPRLRAVYAELARTLKYQSLDDLADEIGVTRSAISNWINGEHPPTVPAMIRLCDKFGLTLDWIYRGKLEGLAYDKSLALEAQVAGLTEAAPVEAPAARARRTAKVGAA